jgi:hypothetical protein
MSEYAYACDECCGHGCEDGRCIRLGEIPEHIDKTLADLEREQGRADKLERELAEAQAETESMRLKCVDAVQWAIRLERAAEAALAVLPDDIRAAADGDLLAGVAALEAAYQAQRRERPPAPNERVTRRDPRAVRVYTKEGPMKTKAEEVEGALIVVARSAQDVVDSAGTTENTVRVGREEFADLVSAVATWKKATEALLASRSTVAVSRVQTGSPGLSAMVELADGSRWRLDPVGGDSVLDGVLGFSAVDVRRESEEHWVIVGRLVAGVFAPISSAYSAPGFERSMPSDTQIAALVTGLHAAIAATTRLLPLQGRLGVLLAAMPKETTLDPRKLGLILDVPASRVSEALDVLSLEGE